MHRPKIYLSFPMEFVKDQKPLKDRMRRLQKKLEKLNYTVYNPFALDSQVLKNKTYKSYLSRHKCKSVRDLKSRCMDCYSALVKHLREFSCKEIESSAIILAFPNTTVSGGMAGELTLASYLDREIYMIISEKDEKALSTWVKSCASNIFTTEDEVLNILS